jgi:hypothetical protein
MQHQEPCQATFATAAASLQQCTTLTLIATSRPAFVQLNYWPKRQLPLLYMMSHNNMCGHVPTLIASSKPASVQANCC